MLKRSSSFIFKAFFAIVGGVRMFVQTTTQRELLPVRVFYSRYLNFMCPDYLSKFAICFPATILSFQNIPPISL